MILAPQKISMLSDEFFRPPIGPPKFVYLRLTMIFKEALKFPAGRVHPAADRDSSKKIFIDSPS